MCVFESSHFRSKLANALAATGTVHIGRQGSDYGHKAKKEISCRWRHQILISRKSSVKMGE